MATAIAHDFSVTVDGQQLYFDIINKAKRTVAVTYKGSISDRTAPDLRGTVEIPSKVRHDSVVYKVEGIGRKAFADADQLKRIVIPAGVTGIGDFAFEDCDSLESVVFPGNPVSLGQGIFFKCPSIAGVTLGSDWKTVDLTMFRWSDALKTVTIPAKVEKIQGVKKLRHLQSIEVDANNARFSSADGMLYSKDGTILYACPRGREGAVTVREGVTKVTDGALIDCRGVTSLDFPASLREVSFRETSEMPGLRSIVMRADRPVDTGYINGKGRFLFRLAAPEVRITVPASAKSQYEEALATEAGEYAPTPGGVPYMVGADELPSKKDIKGTKDFENIRP